MKYRFLVEGMTCAVCSASVEKVVGRKAGVVRAAVNLSAKTLICECEDTLKPEDIIRTVEAAGFSATLKQEAEHQVSVPKSRELSRFLVSLVLLLPLMYLAMGEMLSLYVFPPFRFSSHPLANALVQLVLSLSIVVVNRGFFVRGVKAVRRKSANMDTLVSLGSGASLLYSVIEIVLFATHMRESIGHLYLDSAAMILCLVTFGKFLEERAKNRSTKDLRSLIDLSPRSVHVFTEDGVLREVDAELLILGDVVLVRPGERIPVDGVVLEGESALDTSALTGESVPRDVQAGDHVLSGSLNLSGALRIRAQKRAGESTLAQMVALVEEAGVTRAPAARLADRVASIFVPNVSAIALAVTVLWLVLGYGFDVAFGFGISVLVVSCPCALGLATPVAVTAALGKCASRGILIRDAAVFETMKKSTAVLLDKTGTLTEGRPQVTDVCSLIDESRFLTLAASLEAMSEHPLARAVCSYVPGERLAITDFSAAFGKGVCGACEGKVLLGGNAAHLSENSVDIASLSVFASVAQEEGKTVLFFAYDGKPIGALALFDEPRESAAFAVESLNKRGILTVLISGDRAKCAQNVAARLGVRRAVGGVLPADKEREVRRLQAEGHSVVMVGDGVNDAPALAAAEVGVSFSSGTDIAQNAADVILLEGDLFSLSWIFSFSRRVCRIIFQNLFWAFFYNACMILLAAGALFVPFGIALSPMICAGCMCVSSLFVVTNALRLYRRKEN